MIFKFLRALTPLFHPGHGSGQLSRSFTFQVSISLEPRDVFLYRLMAYRRAERGDFEGAARWAGRGLAAAPGDPMLSRLKTDAAARRLSFRAAFR